jgi:flagella basal body P-ring formation protein FlgA
MRIAIILMAAASLAHGACEAVLSSTIVARDIVTAVPLFNQLDPETFIGFTPFPGTKRVLSSHEMFLLATRHGLLFPTGAPVPSLCVERAVRSLSTDELKPILLAALGIPDVQMEILEVSGQPLPPGRPEFGRETLNRPRNGDPRNPVIWRGQFVYDEHHSLAIWAKLRMSVNREAIVAAQEIPASAVIHAAQLRTTTTVEFPRFESYQQLPVTMDGIEGKIARRTIADGERIVPAALEDAKDVIRGETIRVQAIDGAATITLDAIAQSSGNRGQTIMVHNPSSGKNFRALIEGQRQAIVRLTTGAAL